MLSNLKQNVNILNVNVGQLEIGDFLVIMREEIAPLINIIKNQQTRIASLETNIEKIDDDLDEHTTKLKVLSDNMESFKRIIM